MDKCAGAAGQRAHSLTMEEMYRARLKASDDESDEYEYGGEGQNVDEGEDENAAEGAEGQ